MSIVQKTTKNGVYDIKIRKNASYFESKASPARGFLLAAFEAKHLTLIYFSVCYLLNVSGKLLKSS